MVSLATNLVKVIKQLGCEQAFGIPGKPITPLIMEMENQGINFVLSRHECGAGYMATGYALQNQSLGVALGTSGPGGTNLLTAAGQAKAFNAPVLFITGHPPLGESGKALGQDSSMFGTDLVELFKPLTLFSAKVEDATLLSSYLQHALQKALTGKMGPVHLSIPLDILTQEVPDLDMPNWQIADNPISANLSQVKQLLSTAQKPVILVGKGAHRSKAYQELQTFAEDWQIPVMTTPGGKGAFPTHHPLSLGSFGLGGTAAAETYIEDGIDIMIVIGTRLSDMSTAGLSPNLYPKHIIQFDQEEVFVGKTILVDTLLVKGDAKQNLSKLISQYAPDQPVHKRNLTAYWVEENKARELIAKNEPNNNRLSTATVMLHLRDFLPPDTVVFGDDGSHTFYGIKYFDTLKPGTFYFDDVFGAMGHGLGLAIGASLVKQDQPIVSFVGDGCFMMHGMELSAAVDQQANITFVVFNNGMLDMVDKGMKVGLGKAAGTTYQYGIDATQFGVSIGMESIRCHSIHELEAAIKQAIETDGPSIVEVFTRQDEVPPTLKRG
ncbi:thiamine pyrophosphate-binding protein [Gracilibacillus caseinilyticus]|uniref:Thiamine pyrophosphate-binding protein n=1 Tax=Gracilibacillus caseinilyticus TaxID=2932256 RepID=A0ABY4F3B6_9BACI|nr:thiamine pyrophosphate-binding protein [Gracilibacillus caseinilyticus]UOQ48941.1 thiamine pyrophosphate-binding protein [Gracilibacillus caseinilyticus]